MGDALIVLAVPAVIGFRIWASRLDHRYTVEPATRSEEGNVAGLDSAAEVSWHAWWGNGLCEVSTMHSAPATSR